MAKRPTDVMGNKINCPEFSMCPICYGCRAVNSSSACDICRQDAKQNICNLNLHRPDLIEKFISKTSLTIKDTGVQFVDEKLED